MILHYLLTKLAFAGTMFFAAGATAIAEPAGFSGAPSAEAEPSTNVGEGGSETPSEPTDQPTSIEGETSAPPISGDGKKATDAGIRAHLAELKASNPALHKQLNDVYWGYQNLKGQIAKNFPGGMKEAIELKQELETLGGREAVQELSSEVSEFRQFDEAWMSGDKSFLDRAIEKGGSEGFVKLAPHLTQKWAETDSAGYDKYFAGVMYNTLRESEIPTDLRLAVSTIQQFDLEKAPGLKAVADSLGRAYDWMTKNLKELANKPVEAKPAQGNGIEQERQQLHEQQRQLVTQEIRTQLFRDADATISSVVSALRAGAALSEGGKQQIVADTFANIFKILSAQPGLEQKYDSYLNAGDKEGARKFLASKVTPLLQEQARKAYKHLYGEPTLGSPKPKPNGNGNSKPAGAAPEVGFQLIGYDPKPSNIDYSKTPRAMIFKNQAVLKSGRKVTWRPGAPAEK